MEADFYQDLMEHVVRECRITGAAREKLPEGIEVTVRYSADREYVFIQNFNREPVKCDLTQYGGTLLLGEQQEVIPGLGTAVIESLRKPWCSFPTSVYFFIIFSK